MAERLGLRVRERGGGGRIIRLRGGERGLPLLLDGDEDLAVTLGDFAHGRGRRSEEGFESWVLGFELGDGGREVLRRKLRAGVPERPDGVAALPGLLEISLPAADGGGDEVLVGEDLVEAFLGIFVQLELRDEVVGHAGAGAGGGLGATRGHGGVQLGEAGLVFLFEGGERVGFFGELDLHQFVGAALEDAVERVVIGGRDGVVFVVVAAGALDGQAHRAARHHVNAVVNNLVREADEAAADGEETQRRQVGAFWVLSFGFWVDGVRSDFANPELRTRNPEPNKLVAGYLKLEEAVVGQVGVERVDDPVAVGVGVRVEALLAGVDVALGVRVARDVEPVTRPALAVVRGGEELVGEIADCRLPIADCARLRERLDFLRRRREAGEVVGQAADERARVGGWRGLQVVRLELGEDEVVHGRLRPRLVLHRRHRLLLRRHKGPVRLR